jgi:hypothetical protein
MQTPDPVEQIKTAGTVIGTITGAIGLYALIKKGWQKYREKHPTFRRKVLACLEQIKDGQRRFDDFNAATLRERLGSIYNLYVLEMGWCPRSQKEKIALLFDIHKEYFGSEVEDALMAQDRAMIMSLPESKDQRKDYSQ